MRFTLPTLLAAILLPALAAPARAQGSAQASDDAPRRVALAPYGPERMRAVRVAVGGDTLDFLFDTGGGFTTITPALAARLGCAPAGRVTGRRMTGESVEAPVCRGVPLTLAGVRFVVDAAIVDAQPYGGVERPVSGIVSLHTLRGRALTLDMARGALVLETAASLARRVRGLTPVRTRLATGESGGAATPFVALEAGGQELWFEWDSNHNATTFVSPWAARVLGVRDSTAAADVTLSLSGVAVAAAVQGRPELIHDGVLSASFVARGVWTVDATATRMWVTPLQPLLAPPEGAAEGWYDLTLMDGGQPNAAVLQVRRTAAGLTGALRFVGDERELAVDHVRLADGALEFDFRMRASYPVRLRFEGTEGTGTWGDPAGRGGAATAHRRGG